MSLSSKLQSRTLSHFLLQVRYFSACSPQNLAGSSTDYWYILAYCSALTRVCLANSAGTGYVLTSDMVDSSLTKNGLQTTGCFSYFMGIDRSPARYIHTIRLKSPEKRRKYPRIVDNFIRKYFLAHHGSKVASRSLGS